MLKSWKDLSLDSLIKHREGETKVGEAIRKWQMGESYTTMVNQGISYIVIGIPEDIGPRGNLGFEGASAGWPAFLSAWLNMQHNQFFHLQNIAFGGEIPVINSTKINDIDELRSLCEQNDHIVYEHLKPIFQAGLIPIIIGGGHNNAYPTIKALAESIGAPVNVLNCDAHADFRKLEGRHSGNGFSYAYEKGYLNKYFVLGMHPYYNSDYTFKQFAENKHLSFTFHNSDFVMSAALQEAIKFTGKQIGIELDVDCISNFPSSARTPAGISMTEARYFLQHLAENAVPQYLHICEAAPQNEIEKRMTGKMLAYLVADFCREIQK